MIRQNNFLPRIAVVEILTTCSPLGLRVLDPVLPTMCHNCKKITKFFLFTAEATFL